MINIGIMGALGRMGREIAQEVLKNPQIALKGACIRPHSHLISEDYGTALGLKSLEVLLCDTLSDMDAIDVLIDFSHTDRLTSYETYVTTQPTALVLGTTGLQAKDHATLQKLSYKVPVFYSPNMSVGVHVLQKLVRDAARMLPQTFQTEIIDRHHQFKKDAPSGTALMLAQHVATQRQQILNEVMATQRTPTHQRRDDHEIGVLSLRAGGIVGQHDVYFVSEAEQISISHQAFSRRVFAQGALQAAQFLITQKPGLYGMDDLVSSLE